jgi:hypothetical protein
VLTRSAVGRSPFASRPPRKGLVGWG